MKIIVKERGQGKTTGLIYASEATNYRIITNTCSQAGYVEKLAEEIGCIIPKPMSYKDYKKLHMRDAGILLDEINYMLEDILNEYFNGVHVLCGTMSCEKI